MVPKRLDSNRGHIWLQYGKRLILFLDTHAWKEENNTYKKLNREWYAYYIQSYAYTGCIQKNARSGSVEYYTNT